MVIFPSGGTVPTPTDVVRTPRLPRKDDVIAAVAQTVAAKWAANKQITLAYMTQAQFVAAATAFSTSLNSRKTTGSGRASKTQTLRNLDAQIEKGISSLKLDLTRKYDSSPEDAFAQYSRYGMEKKPAEYVLPKMRVQRLAAIKLIPAALLADGLSGGQYDKTFWNTLIINYTAALNGANTTDSSVSNLVGTKNVQRATLLKAMRSLMLVIQGNYPDTYESMYREWGWQKEDY